MLSGKPRANPIRRGAITIGGLAVLVLLIYADASLTARTYFHLESFWSEHWPIKSEQRLLDELEPALRRLRVLRPARVEVEPGISFYLDPSDLIPIAILKGGQWQPEIWDAMSPSLSAGGVFLDVGAHIGYFSIKAARKVGRTGRVVSFDPNPEILKLLRDNVTANHADNVIVEPIACTDRDQMLTFYAVETVNTGGSSLARRNAEGFSHAPRSYQVRGRPIDDVIRELNLSRVDVIKVDVEGAEVSVIRGSIDTLKRFHPKLIIEVKAAQLANLQTTPEELVALIKSAGYDRSRPLNREKEDWEWTVGDAHTFSSIISVNSPSAATQFIRGVHPGEGIGRWTDSNFTVALLTPPAAAKNGAWLSLKIYVPKQSIEALKSLTLSARIGNAALAPQTYTTDEVYEYRREVPASAFGKNVVDVDFSVDKFLNLGGQNFGVVVMNAGLEPR